MGIRICVTQGSGPGALVGSRTVLARVSPVRKHGAGGGDSASETWSTRTTSSR